MPAPGASGAIPTRISTSFGCCTSHQRDPDRSQKEEPMSLVVRAAIVQTEWTGDKESMVAKNIGLAELRV